MHRCAGRAVPASADTRAALLAFRDIVDASALEVACGDWEEMDREPCAMGQPWGCVLCSGEGQVEGLQIDYRSNASQPYNLWPNPYYPADLELGLNLDPNWDIDPSAALSASLNGETPCMVRLPVWPACPRAA